MWLFDPRTKKPRHRGRDTLRADQWLWRKGGVAKLNPMRRGGGSGGRGTDHAERKRASCARFIHGKHQENLLIPPTEKGVSPAKKKKSSANLFGTNRKKPECKRKVGKQITEKGEPISYSLLE